MGAVTGIARERDRPPTSRGRVQEVQVVEHPQRVKSRLASHAALLPVDPPEINALRFHRVDDLIEVSGHEHRRGRIELNRAAGLGINAHCPSHAIVAVLERTYAVSRMQVKRGFETPLMQPSQKTFRVGEQGAVPGESGPP